jgi:hypothetical protein
VPIMSNFIEFHIMFLQCVTQQVFIHSVLLEFFQNFMLKPFCRRPKTFRCYSWGSALTPSPLVTPPRIMGNREATRSCSVSSQTDLHSLVDGPIRVGRSEDDDFYTLCLPS